MFVAEEINLNNKEEVDQLKDFLKTFKVAFEMPEKTYVVRNDEEIIATGSSNGNVLKYFFVNYTAGGRDAATAIFKKLLEHVESMGYKSYFVFTSPNYKAIFLSFGLEEVSSTDKVTLLEGGNYNIEKWIEDTKKQIGPKKGKRGAIVANCNPMTLGHKYLIAEALENVDELLFFVVEEDSSVFPMEKRLEIVKEELKGFENIIVLKGGSYIISRGTFPTYFIKKEDVMLDIYTELDATIFGQRIAKGLEINTRFLGTENLDYVTNAYNRALIKVLDDYNIETKLIPRLKIGERTVSASYVRNLIKEDKLDEAYKFLTLSTKEYLETEEGKVIIDRIKNENAN